MPSLQFKVLDQLVGEFVRIHVVNGKRQVAKTVLPLETTIRLRRAPRLATTSPIGRRAGERLPWADCPSRKTTQRVRRTVREVDPSNPQSTSAYDQSQMVEIASPMSPERRASQWHVSDEGPPLTQRSVQEIGSWRIG
jgi:hypothetical protein